jgi:uncharacterized repeat protein (TIGR01451 family)
MKRVISTVLAVTMLVVSLPFTELSTSAFGWFGFGSGMSFGGNWGRPGQTTTADVMTNVKVEFQDTKYQSVSTVESGELFYLYLSLAGNNVNQSNTSTTYTIEITDNNLLLPNFAGSGLRDGAKYNGFTMHVETDSSGNITRRYLTYDIANGQTKAVWLQAKFANGTTPDGDQATVTLTASGSGQSKSSSVTATSKMEWDDSKTANMSTISIAQINSGTDITYTLKAYPNYTSDKQGEWWVDEVEMTDTIELPPGLSFDEAPTLSNISQYITFSDNVDIGNEDFDFEIVESSTTKVTVRWIIKSTNTGAEMAPCTVTATLNVDKLVVGSFESGKIQNKLSVRVNGVNDNESTWVKLTDRNADVSISAPEPAKISLSKNVAGTAGTNGSGAAEYYSSKGYLVCGEYVLFEVYAKNDGESAATGTMTLTDVVPDGLTPVSDVSINGHTTDGTVDGQTVTWTHDALAAGKDFTGYVVCKVDSDISDTLKSVRNVVYLGTPSQYESIATAYVSIKKPSASYEIYKSVDKSIYTAGDTLTYTIKIKNTGEQGIEFESLVDNFSQTGAVDVTTNEVPTGSFKVAAGEEVSYKVVATVLEGASGDLTNTATATPSTSGLTEKSASVTVSQNAFNFGDGSFSKVGDTTVSTQGGTANYTLNYHNGTKNTTKFTEGNELVFQDTLPAGLTLASVTFAGKALAEGKDNAVEIGSDGSAYYTKDGQKVTIYYTGSLGAYSGFTAVIGTTIDFTATGVSEKENDNGATYKVITANTAYAFLGANDTEKKEASSENEIKESLVALSVDKFAITEDYSVDKITNSTIDLSGETITDWNTAIADDGVIQETIGSGEYDEVLPGQLMTFYIKVTNTGKETINGFKLTDTILSQYYSGDSYIKIVDSDKTTLQSGAMANYQSISEISQWYDKLGYLDSASHGTEKVTLFDSTVPVSIEPGGYVVLAYQLVTRSASLSAALGHSTWLPFWEGNGRWCLRIRQHPISGW